MAELFWFRLHAPSWDLPKHQETNGFPVTYPKPSQWLETSTGFIAGVLGETPKSAEALVTKMFPLPDKQQAVII
jgi:hypothetical protein